jgi:hypothetical protein
MFDWFDKICMISNYSGDNIYNGGGDIMANDRMDLSDKTAISMPMRNLLSILAAVGIGVYAFFGIQERLNNVETRSTLMEADLTKNTRNSG